MPWLIRVIFLGFAGAITVACGPRPSESPGATRPEAANTQKPAKKRSNEAKTKPSWTGEQASGREAFDALSDLAKGASIKQRSLGEASYYADSLAGNRMAGGERYEPDMPVAAHRTLPFGTVVRVVRISDGKSVVVRITDRGPFGSKRRLIDLSKSAAERLGMLRAGVVEVRVEVLDVK